MVRTLTIVFFFLAITVAHAPALEGDIETTVTLDYQDAEVLTIYNYLAEVRGCNLVVYPGVSGNITLKLLDVPWEQAMNAVLKTMGHEMRIGGNVIEIAPAGYFLER